MKKSIKKLAYLTLVLAAIIGVALAIHLKDVMGDDKNKGNAQLARIDIRENFSQDDFEKIKSEFKRIDGVTHAYIDPESKRLIFSFNPKTHNSEKIFEEFQKGADCEAALYQASESLAASGCPMNQDGVVGKLTSLFD